jgi:hypothetical protein
VPAIDPWGNATSLTQNLQGFSNFSDWQEQLNADLAGAQGAFLSQQSKDFANSLLHRNGLRF